MFYFSLIKKLKSKLWKIYFVIRKNKNMSIKRESASNLRFDVSCKLWLPSVTIFKQFFFTVEKFFMSNGSALKVWSFNDSVDWTSSLTKSTINTLGHVNIVFGSSSWSIWSWLTFNCDSFSWTGSSTQFTGNTSSISIILIPLFSSSISSQSVLTSEFWWKRSFFIWIMNSPLGFEDV